MPIIDAWMQHPTGGFMRREEFASLRRWMGMGDDVPDQLPIELTIGALDAAGVDLGLLCAWYGPDGAWISNDEVLAQVRQHPDRLVGVASVDLRRPKRAVDELRRMTLEHGFRGLRVLPWLWGLPPDHRLYYPLYVACIELDIPFCLQVGHAGPLRPSEPGRPIPYLDQVACDFPELRIVGGHIGYPWTTEMIALATKYPNVYIDTSAYAPRRYPPELVSFLRGHGRDKVLFGSNYPMLMPERCVGELAALDLDERTTAAFLGGTAARVFGLNAAWSDAPPAPREPLFARPGQR
jgi:predicted TIM-barrel fold metal-dependent hydrolase